MPAPRVLLTSVIALFAVAALTASQQVRLPKDSWELRAASRFAAAVGDYMTPDRAIEDIDLDRLCLPDDSSPGVNAPATAFNYRAALHEADIFSPDVATMFRKRIAAALRHDEYNATDLMAVMNQDELMASAVVVNQPLASDVGRVGLRWFAALPTLPTGLAYRLVGRDLVLVDLRNSVVVDVLRGAVSMS